MCPCREPTLPFVTSTAGSRHHGTVSAGNYRDVQCPERCDGGVFHIFGRSPIVCSRRPISISPSIVPSVIFNFIILSLYSLILRSVVLTCVVCVGTSLEEPLAHCCCYCIVCSAFFCEYPFIQLPLIQYLLGMKLLLAHMFQNDSMQHSFLYQVAAPK